MCRSLVDLNSEQFLHFIFTIREQINIEEMFQTSWRFICSLQWKVRSFTEQLGISILRAHSHTKVYLSGQYPQRMYIQIHKQSSKIFFISNSVWCKWPTSKLKYLHKDIVVFKILKWLLWSSCVTYITQIKAVLTVSNIAEIYWNVTEPIYIHRNIKLSYLWYKGLSYTKIHRQPNGRKLPLDLQE